MELTDKDIKNIISICYTMRHDYGLPVNEECPFIMTQAEKDFIFSEAKQLYMHHMKPLVDMLDEIYQNLSLQNSSNNALLENIRSKLYNNGMFEDDLEERRRM